MGVAQELDWAVSRWHAEVANRPMQNVSRRSLDTSWRQVIRRFGGDDVALCGPAHDELMQTYLPRTISQTHTYVELELSKAAYDEIATKLRAAGYDHAFMDNEVIDMHGLAIIWGSPPWEPGDRTVVCNEASLLEALTVFKDDAGSGP